MKPCKIEDCTGVTLCRGMCKSHYEKWRRRNPTAVIRSDNLREQVIAALPGTRFEVETKLGINRSTAQTWIRRLRDENVIHVRKWQRPSVTGPFVAVFAAGRRKDAPCVLESRKPEDYQHRYKERKRAYESKRYYTNKAKAKPNGIFGALGL